MCCFLGHLQGLQLERCNLSTNLLILGGRSPVALHLIRYLGKGGEAVYVADSLSVYTAKHSKYVKQSFVLPSPVQNVKHYGEELQNIIQNYHIQHIIPTCEEAFWLSQCKKELEEKTGVHIWCGYPEEMNLLHHKYDFIAWCKTIGIPVAETKQVNRSTIEEEWMHIEDGLWVLKPCYSRFGSAVHIGTKQELQQVVLGNREWVVQRYIEGTQFCSYSTVFEGKVAKQVVYETKYTFGKGTNIYFERVDVPMIDSYVEKIAEKLNYNGQLSFDWIMTKEGKVYPIECNPRATSGLHLIGEKGTWDSLQEKNTRSFHSYGIKLLLLKKMWKRLFSKEMKHVFWNSKDVVWDVRDPLPFLSQNLMMLKWWKQSKKEKKKIEELTTIDIEWNGER